MRKCIGYNSKPIIINYVDDNGKIVSTETSKPRKIYERLSDRYRRKGRTKVIEINNRSFHLEEDDDRYVTTIPSNFGKRDRSLPRVQRSKYRKFKTSVALDINTVEEIEAIAKKDKVTFSEQIRLMIEAGLESWKDAEAT